MDVQSIRGDFPTIRNSNSIYMDSACQSLKPDCVIESVMRYYNEFPACGGRSVHSMATSVSIGVDESREKLAEFFNYDDLNCFAFTKNCTEGMNIIAHGFGLRRGGKCRWRLFPRRSHGLFFLLHPNCLRLFYYLALWF